MDTNTRHLRAKLQLPLDYSLELLWVLSYKSWPLTPDLGWWWLSKWLWRCLSLEIILWSFINNLQLKVSVGGSSWTLIEVNYLLSSVEQCLMMLVSCDMDPGHRSPLLRSGHRSPSSQFITLSKFNGRSIRVNIIQRLDMNGLKACVASLSHFRVFED